MLRRLRLVRQNDQSDCGAAALATLALYHRLPVALEQMRMLTGTDREGTSLGGLVAAAREMGFNARAVRGSTENLSAIPLPAVAHVVNGEGHGHFVVIERVARRHVRIADPAGAVAWRRLDAFAASWTGNLLLATPDAAAGCRRRGRTPTRPWQRFGGLLWPHRALLGEVVASAVLMTCLAVSNSYFVQHLVDSVLVRRDLSLLNALGLGMLLVVLFRTLFGVLRHYLLAYLGRKVDLILIGGYLRQVVRLPLRFFETRKTGEILSRVSDAAKLREAVNGTTTGAVVDTLVVAAVLALLWCYDWPLALATTAVVPVFLAAVGLHHPAAKARAREAMEHGAQLTAHLVEDVAGIDTIKASCAEEERTHQGEARLVRFAQSLFALQQLEMRLGGISLLITGAAGVGILWFGGHRVASGALTVGQLMFFYTLLGTLLDPLNRLATVNLKIQDALVAIDRLFQVLDLEPEPTAAKGAKFTGLKREIALCGVGFRYGSRGNVLDGLELRIPAGSTVAIVGESGSGKSTLIKLLLRYYAPTAGRIQFDATNLGDFELASLRSRIGVVPQDPYIFNGTIRENIAISRPAADLAAVAEAARLAGLDEFIDRLPQRYDTLIGERGTNLSGGQRQRMAIARALVGDPDLLIFDEATSHLDTATERLIQANLRGALGGRTVIVVAHRLSTIREADLIVVLHEGRICEQGTHHELLKRRGRYRALWENQSGDQLPDGGDCRCGRSNRELHPAITRLGA